MVKNCIRISEELDPLEGCKKQVSEDSEKNE